MSNAAFTPRDLAKWSWRAAIEGAIEGRVSGVIAEADRELRRQYFSDPMATHGRQFGSPHSFLVPNEILFRDLRRDLQVAGTGGYLVETTNGDFLDALYPMLATARLGAQRLQGLVGNVTLPRQSAGTTAYWLTNESTQVTESQPTLGQVALTPKTVGAYTEVSRQLLLQSSPAVDTIVSRELAKRVATALDVAALAGSGSAGQPQGIIGAPSVGSFTATSADLAKLLEAQSDIASADGDSSVGAYVTTPAVAAILAGRQRFTGSDRSLWEGALSDGQVAGCRAISSTNVPSGHMIFGDWSQLILASWAGSLMVEANPFANFQSGVTGLRILALVDVGIANAAGGFSVSTSVT